MHPSNDEDGLAEEVRRLAARVEQLEREMVVLRAENHPLRTPPPPPTRVVSQTMEEAMSPAAPPEAPAQEQPRARGGQSLENRLGAQIFNRIGIVALLVAAALGLKLAIDNQWIGPVGRIVIGLIAGAGLIAWSERFRRKGFPAFSYSLKAVGTGILYLSLWAAFQLYHLLPSSVALAGMLVVMAWNAFMAWAQNAELLAAFALVGGLATPLLLSTGENHEVFLFTYLLALDAATVLLVRLKPWSRLLLAAFPATVVYFIGWYWKFFAEPAFAVTTVFVALFFVVFVSSSVGSRSYEEDATQSGRWRMLGLHTREILLPLGNAAFVSLALYSVLQDSSRHWFLPWLMLLLAAAYLLITRLRQGPTPAAIHLSLAVVFLTIAIPLKASGHWITAAWLVEGLALLWAATRLGNVETGTERSNSAAVLRWLSAGSLVLGLTALVAKPFWFGEGTATSLLNHEVATALIAVGVLSGAVWLSLRAGAKQDAEEQYKRFALASMAAIGGVAALLALREVATSWHGMLAHVAFANADFGMAVLAIAILGAMVYSALRFALRDESLAWLPVSAASVVAINVIAILTGVREIRALWPAGAANPDVELQRSLAVSGFLMLYAAALLAVGFWKRSSFVRWQALVLLVFSIAKTFLYDLRNLSQGYRFVSFLALGALLMAISFAYQKDWLALRGRQTEDDGDASMQRGVRR